MSPLQSILKYFLPVGICLLNMGFAGAQQNKPQALIKVPDPLTAPEPAPGMYPTGMPLNFVRTWVPQGKYTDPNLILTESYLHIRQSTQYQDGLGRPIQIVQRQGSPAAKDVVTPLVYDAFGREEFKFLPYVDVNGTSSYGAFKSDPFNSQKSFYQSGYKDANNVPMLQGEQFFYSRNIFEASPLSRLQESFAPVIKGLVKKNGHLHVLSSAN